VAEGEKMIRIVQAAIQLVVVAAIMSVMVPIAAAGTVHEFHKAEARAMRGYRWASFYLRTGNLALAEMELGQFADGATKLVQSYAVNPPDIYSTDDTWPGDLRKIAQLASEAQAALSVDNVEEARAKLTPIRALNGDMRRRNGVFLFVDCIDIANHSFTRLFRFRHNPPNFQKPEQLDSVRQDLAETLYWYRQCLKAAPVETAQDSRFRRLVETSIVSLEKVWGALRAGEERRMINLLREVASSNRLLYLQFG
jgi:hypothetical protein